MNLKLTHIVILIGMLLSEQIVSAQMSGGPPPAMIKSMLLQQGLTEDLVNEFIGKVMEIQQSNVSKNQKHEKMKSLFKEYGVQPPGSREETFPENSISQ